MPCDLHLISERRAGRGKEIREASGLHAWQLLQFGYQTLLQLTDLVAILVPGRADVKGDRVVGVEAGGNSRQRTIAAHEQPCRASKDHAERDLRDNERSLQAMTAAEDPASGGREHRRQPAPGRQDRGQQAEESRRPAR